MSNDISSLVADAERLFERAVQRVQAPELLGSVGPADWGRRPVDEYDKVRVVGMGKAAMAMAGVVEQQLGGRVNEGVAVVPEGYPRTLPDFVPAPSRIEVVEGGHPLPSTGSTRAARRILECAAASGTHDLLIVLVSGGGTATSTRPAGDLELTDLKTTYHHLLTAGVDIHAANTVRKHLTQLGGGQLAERAVPADVTSLVIADVVGDDISVIASGPTYPDPTTYEDAVRILYSNDLWHDVPTAVRSHLTDGARGRHPETPDAGHPCFEATQNVLLGTNRLALDAAVEAAGTRGYDVRSVVDGVEGEARDVGAQHAREMLGASPQRPTCWLWGGEPTVTVTGDGTGGRNQEAALGAARVLSESETDAVFLSAGTDGIDGPTDAAGAWATPETWEQAKRQGCDPERHLANNDSYSHFETLDQLIHTGPTHTNVMDIQIGLVRPV